MQLFGDTLPRSGLLRGCSLGEAPLGARRGLGVPVHVQDCCSAVCPAPKPKVGVAYICGVCDHKLCAGLQLIQIFLFELWLGALHKCCSSNRAETDLGSVLL